MPRRRYEDSYTLVLLPLLKLEFVMVVMVMRVDAPTSSFVLILWQEFGLGGGELISAGIRYKKTVTSQLGHFRVKGEGGTTDS